MNLKKLETHFYEARDAVYKIRDNDPKNEADRLCQWLLKTDVNPYSLFFDDNLAVSCLSIEGLYTVCHLINHALLDDGALSFISMNGEPVIVMLHPSDFNDPDDFLQFIMKNDRKRCLRGETQYRLLNLSPDEFIQAREDYEAEHIKSCFNHDAELHGVSTAVKSYQDMPRFNRKWIEDFQNNQ